MGAHDDVPGQEPLSDRPAAGLAIVGLGASLAPLDIAVNIALPAITAHFGLALGDVQWLVICYVLVYGSLMLVCGKLGDLFGHRLIFRIGLAISAVGCAACDRRHALGLLDRLHWQRLQDAPGFTPVIIDMQPLKNVQMFLGLSNAADKAPAVQ